ncbi:MAG TPA: SH3 domain-containing protein, partial [Anaerolineae bacterium]|nr:SH3 domain-containing protein [Anaerolineae bacterium]
MNRLTPFILLILFLLTACASPSSVNPTPTLVRLDRSALAEATVTTVAATSTVSDTLPSATSTAIPVATPPASSVSSTTTGPATATFDTAAQVEVVTPAVNLRVGPGLDYDVISVAKEGDQFAVTGLSPSGAWLQIVTADGKPGWVTAASAYTRLIDVEVDDLPIIEAGATPSNAAVTEAVTSELASSGQTAALTGGQLIFATGSGGDLYSVNADGTGLQKLASGVIDPVVSLDGTQVAFTRWDGDDWGAVYTLSLVNGVERVVAGDMLQPKSPTWSPDGQTLVVSFQHGGLRDPKEECRRYDLGERVRVPEGSQITGTTYNGDKGQ